MDNESCIAVTHFINPHLFWYKIVEDPGEGLHVLTNYEQNLLELYKNKPASDNFLRAQKGDKVAVNFIAWNKYIRAEILEKVEFQQEEYIVWAFDYGFPLQTKKEYLRSLPIHLRADVGCICVGGIADIYPAEQEYDDMEGNLVMVKKDKWLQKTCNMLEKLLADASSISFSKRYRSEDGHVWGDISIINHKGILINGRDYLLRTANAVEENGASFKTNCSKLMSIKIAPWLSNDRNTKLKYNNIKHNYIEHSQQINLALVDENAKRKVEDWQQRNEKKKSESVPEAFEGSSELSEDNVDDITFDDSVSMANWQQINYMGKAGILTKIKQQKYASFRDLPPIAPPKCFEINDEIFKLSSPRKVLHAPSLLSESTYASSAETISHSSKLHAGKNLLEDNSGSSSSITKTSSVKERQQILFQMRKKIAREGKDKLNNSGACQKVINHREPNTTTSSQSKSLDSYPYDLLQQSLTISTSSNAPVENEQDTKSELSVKNVRIKQLMAMRKKCGSSSITSSNNDSLVDNTTDPLASTSAAASKAENVFNEGLKNDAIFRLEPKTGKQVEDITKELPQMYSVNQPSKANMIKKNIEMCKSGFDSFTMVPAGFDVTRLDTYRDEKNHWHRKKSTRNDYVPHQNLSSTDENHSNGAKDQSYSSSDVSLNQSFNASSNHFGNKNSSNQKTFKVAEIEPESQVMTSYKQHNSLVVSELKNLSGNNLSSGISTSSNSSAISYRQKNKRRQLKSPASQLHKIDQILHEHCVEKNKGNKNILDLHLLNTSSSSQKSLLRCASSNISYQEEKQPHNSIMNNGASHSASSGDNVRNEKVFKDVLNYEAIMDVKHTETLPVVEGERKIQTKYIDHLVLAHSSVQVTAIENISEAPFLSEIHEELRQMRVNKVYRIQVYSWCHIARNNSLFVVNPSKSGKTWSYLPPLCSLICCRKDTFPFSYGPVAIILVASFKHVELVNRYCRRLMSGFRNEAPTCVASYGMRNLNETKLNLLNGCGILIGTPSSVLRLLHENENEHLFDADRLQHIVIDDMDIMMSRSQEDFEQAYTMLFKMAKKTKLKKLFPQLIVTSRDWDGLMMKFIQKSNQPLLLMGDFLEAAVYGHATLSVKLRSNNEKNKTVLKFLEEVAKSAKNFDNRTLVICNDDDDVQNVHKFLLECGYSCLSFFSRSMEAERVAIDEWKRKVSSQILVCTDNRFCELKVQNVNNLIHYSMPSSWTQFTFRFSALARTYYNFVSHFELSTATAVVCNKKNNAYSMILLDENNNMQLPRLVDFMHKHNQSVKEEIQAVSKRLLIMREEQRIMNVLCPQILEFGECDESRCDYRHELTRFDVVKRSDNIPSTGEIRLHVLKVFSPTYYAVRLLRHKPPDNVTWQEIRRSSEALTFSIQLNKHYSDYENLSLHWPPHINDICIYQYADNYRRARILEAPHLQSNEINIVQSHLRVTLKLIDEGSVISSVKCSEIFLCDEKFKHFPAQATDVRLLRVVPFDNDRSWDSKTTKQVEKWIIEDIKSNYVVQASIDFAFANTIWVKNIVVMEKLEGIDAYCQVVNLKKTLVEKNFGVLYNGNRRQVRDLVEQFDLLNASQVELDSGDSELDYQSCKNESEDLIKFSSSNDETVNMSIDTTKADLAEIQNNKVFDLEQESHEDSKLVGSENKQEENWDNDPQHSEVYDPFQISRAEKDETTKEESWIKLSLNELVKVEIGDEGENGNWENVFLQTIDKKSMCLFDELNILIVKHVEQLKANNKNQQRTYDLKPSLNCLVKYNNLYLRAKIYAIYGVSEQQKLYRFFLCDYACFTNAKAEELYEDFFYETTDEIVTFTPYQAVHCTLAGIKWDCFTKRYPVTKDYLYACAVAENITDPSGNADLKNFPIMSYKILLFECEKDNEFSNASLFNKVLLEKGITVCDEETKPFLEYEIGNAESERGNSNGASNEKQEVAVPTAASEDKVLTYEELIDFIKLKACDIDMNDVLLDGQKLDKEKANSNAVECKDTSKQPETDRNIEDVSLVEKKKVKGITELTTSDSESEEQGHCTSISNSSNKSSASLISGDVSNGSASESRLPAVPFLKALHKRPQTTWYQNDCMIFLSVHAPDINNYFLEVTSKTLLFVATIQSEKFVLILNFLASVDCASVSHEIKGLNVVVRLKKTYFIKWPRLLQQSTKYSWLKYNFNAFDTKEMEYIVPQQNLHNMLVDTETNYGNQDFSNYNSDDDSERELYQTYNAIQDNDDDGDPFSNL